MSRHLSGNTRSELAASLARRGTGKRSRAGGEYVKQERKEGVIWKLVRLFLRRKKHSHKRENERRMRQVARGILKPNWEVWHEH